MNVGKLNRQLTLQKIGGTNAYGESAEWTTLKKVWADFSTSEAPSETSTHELIIRANKDIEKDSCRFIYKDRIFLVVNTINVDERNVYMKVILKEEKNRTV